MYALEFEADIRDKVLPLPVEVANRVNPGQHVRVILLLDETTPTQTAKSALKNPLEALLESPFIGCAEADSKLSLNYKAELSKSLWEKYGYR